MCDTYRTKHWKYVFVCMDQSVRIRTSIYQLNIANEFNAQAQNIFQYQLLWVAIYLLVALVVHRRFSSAHFSFFPHHRIGTLFTFHSEKCSRSHVPWTAFIIQTDRQSKTKLTFAQRKRHENSWRNDLEKGGGEFSSNRARVVFGFI